MSAKGRDHVGTTHQALFVPDGTTPGGTLCGLAFHWVGYSGNLFVLERAHDLALVTCLGCAAAPDDPGYNPWA